MFGVLKRNILLLVQYSGVGVTAFTVDLVLFWILTRYTTLHYVLDTTLAFIVGTSVHFLLTSRFVFRKAERTGPQAYRRFLVVAGFGLLLTSILMYVAVDFLGLPPVAARVLVGGFVGVLSFIAHKKVSFKQTDAASA